MKAKKGKAGIECACSAEPSPGQIKVTQKELIAGRAEGGGVYREKERRMKGDCPLLQMDRPKEKW